MLKPSIFKKIINRLIRFFLWPIARFYAKHLEDKPADKLYGFLSSIVFYNCHNYWPNLKSPKSFSEKIFYRMLFDRRKILTSLSDKLEARNYVANKVGQEYLVPLIGLFTDPYQIQPKLLPDKFVLKANHGCGFIRIIKNKNLVDFEKEKRLMETWLKTNFCLDAYFGYAWAYKNIIPKILVEEYLEEDGKPPKDYKFYCFSGKVEYILIVYDRFGLPRKKHFYRDFTPIDLWKGTEQYPGPFSPPDNLDQMITLAEQLSAGFDFVRIDLYNIHGKIYFGEFTFYPAGGLARFVPRQWDFIFGEKWNLSKRRK